MVINNKILILKNKDVIIQQLNDGYYLKNIYKNLIQDKKISNITYETFFKHVKKHILSSPAVQHQDSNLGSSKTLNQGNQDKPLPLSSNQSDNRIVPSGNKPIKSSRRPTKQEMQESMRRASVGQGVSELWATGDDDE